MQCPLWRLSVQVHFRRLVLCALKGNIEASLIYDDIAFVSDSDYFGLS